MNLSAQFQNFLLVFAANEFAQGHVHEVFLCAKAGELESASNEGVIEINVGAHIHTKSQDWCIHKAFYQSKSGGGGAARGLAKAGRVP